jgi:hypothetical protein
MAKSNLLATTSPGSRALTNAKHERYCRLRASLQPRIAAYREAGWETSDDENAYSNACRLERRPALRARIEYLSHQKEDLIPEKRRRIEEQLWAVLEADIGEFWETYEAAKVSNGKLATDQDGKMLTVRKQRAKLINDLPPEARKLIEDVSVDRNGNVIPKLYSKAQASRDLRQMHNFGTQTDRPESDVSRLSDAELLQQLADLSKQLGVEMKLDVAFAAAVKASSPADSQVIDIESESGTPSAANAADAAAATELRIAAEPTVAGARPFRKARGSKA